jgi:hypothetical protein
VIDGVHERARCFHRPLSNGRTLLEPESHDGDRREDGHGNEERQDENDEVRAQSHRCVNRALSMIGPILTSHHLSRWGNLFPVTA